MAEMENAIFTNMCMVYDGAGNILVQNRRNLNWPGITFPGGHVEHGESFSGSVIREVKEETGLTLDAYRLRGVVTFDSDAWPTEYMFLYTADEFHGTMSECDEGTLEWVPKEEVYDLPIWEGDKIFFRLLEERESFFSLKLSYQGDTLTHAILDGTTRLK